MRTVEDSTLWRISAYERWIAENGNSGFAPLTPSTVLPTTLNAELSTLERKHLNSDVPEVVAACAEWYEGRPLPMSRMLRIGTELAVSFAAGR